MVGVTVLEVSPWGGKGLPGQDELPCDDGEPMETAFHHLQGHVLIDSLGLAWKERSDFYVAGNMFVYFSEHQVKRNDFRGPDVFVVLGAQRKPRKSWVAWEEGGKLPDVVLEVTSDTTRNVDREVKMRLYAKIWRTPVYFIFDPDTEQLDGYRLDVDRLEYAELPRDERGDFDAAAMGLKVGLRQTHYLDYDCLFVRWLDLDGIPLPTGQELALAALQSEQRQRQRADQAQELADQAQERAERAQQHAEQAQQHAEQAQQRAEQAQLRALEADGERDRALARVRELEVALAKTKPE